MYKENDNLNIEAIEVYRKMSSEERKKLLETMEKEVRKQREK